MQEFDMSGRGDLSEQVTLPPPAFSAPGTRRHQDIDRDSRRLHTEEVIAVDGPKSALR
jgi:hypothetical protein